MSTFWFNSRAGCGKTVFAKTLAKHKNLKMLTVQNIQGLKDLNESYDMIFFDDTRLENIDTQELLQIFECNNKSQIRILYGIKNKKATLIQLFALYSDALKRIRHKLYQPPFLRRFNIMPVDHNN